MEIVEPRMRGLICTTAHPVGCASHVARQKATAERPKAQHSGGNLLVIGGSTGYGLASRITGAFRYGMHSVGVVYERETTAKRTASAGWYNTAAFTREARSAGLAAVNINGDAFSDEVMAETLAAVRRLGPLDVFVYSLAAPQRTDPATGITYRSVLKTIGLPMTAKTVDFASDQVTSVTVEPATQDEILGTVAVMGGADLARWVDALLTERLLAKGARVVAYSWIGPEVTWPVYRSGTIGRAKADLEVTCSTLSERLAGAVGGSCRVSICKSIVSQASTAIPSVPLYMSILFKVMKEAGCHEGPIEQMVRLFDSYLAPGSHGPLDQEHRIRLDGVEMQPEIQAEVLRRWHQIDTSNLFELSDYAGFRRYFHQLFGFMLPGVDYTVPVETVISLDGD